MIIYQYNLDTFVGDFLAVRDNFSREGLSLLFEFYDSIGEPVEFDPIAMCCDWTEYPSPYDAMQDICGIEYIHIERSEFLRLLREGMTPAEALEEVLGRCILWDGETCFLVGV